MGWAALRRLANAGIEIGTHGWDHRPLCGDPDRLAAELTEARVRSEHELGRQVAGMSYPHGLASTAGRRAALAAGYAYACGSAPGRNAASRDGSHLRRNEMFATDRSPLLVIGKLAGSDDWFGPVRDIENALRCRS